MGKANMINPLGGSELTGEEWYKKISNGEFSGKIAINNTWNIILPDMFINSGITGCYFKANPVKLSTSTSRWTHYSFYQLSTIKSILIPHSESYGSLGNYFAANCDNLKLIILKSWGSNCQGSTFINSKNIKSFILSSNQLQKMGNVNTFSNTGISNGTGFVYVPDALVDSYKTANQWTTYANQIKGFSEVDSYSANTTYSIGDVCKNNGKFYAWINETDGNSLPNGDVDSYTDWYCVATI